jgi:hypothetical protein
VQLLHAADCAAGGAAGLWDYPNCGACQHPGAGEGLSTCGSLQVWLCADGRDVFECVTVCGEEHVLFNLLVAVQCDDTCMPYFWRVLVACARSRHAWLPVSGMGQNRTTFEMVLTWESRQLRMLCVCNDSANATATDSHTFFLRALCLQWADELQRHITPGGLSVKVYSGQPQETTALARGSSRSRSSSPAPKAVRGAAIATAGGGRAAASNEVVTAAQLAAADIVLTTYDIIRREAGLQPQTDDAPERNLRHRKRCVIVAAVSLLVRCVMSSVYLESKHKLCFSPCCTPFAY